MEREMLGARIRQQRKEKKISGEKLAEMVDISAVFMGEIERGRRFPSMPTFIRIANALDVSADWLLQDSLHAARDVMAGALAEQAMELEGPELALAASLVESVARYAKRRQK